jgi:hypothetical protein
VELPGALQAFPTLGWAWGSHSKASFEAGGIDDDLLVLTLADDPAARPLRLLDTSSSAAENEAFWYLFKDDLRVDTCRTVTSASTLPEWR